MTPVGVNIGPYRILRHWATGDTSQVFLARRADSSTLAALKVLRADLAHADDLAARFQREAQIAQQVFHPYLTKTLEVVDHDGSPAIAMEFLDGETMEDVFEALHPQTRMPAALGIEIVAQLAYALHHLHERGGVHADVCPANIIITHSGVPKVVDFGGRCNGVATYLAPEQARGLAVDHRSDVFALGLILFEVLTGRRVRQGTGDIEITADAIGRRVPSISSLIVADPELEALVMRAVATDPDDRFASAKAMADALVAYRRQVVPGLELQGALRDFMRQHFHPASLRVSTLLSEAPPLPSDSALIASCPPLGYADPREAVEHAFRSTVFRPSSPFSELPGDTWSSEKTPTGVDPVPSETIPITLDVHPRRTWLWALAATILLAIGGAAFALLSPTGPAIRTLSLTSAPPDASVYLDGKLAGHTPLKLEIQHSATRVALEHRGFKRLEMDVPAGEQSVHLMGALEPLER